MRSRSAVRPGGGDRGEDAPSFHLAGAAPSAHRLQPRRTADRTDGEGRAGVDHAEQRQPRSTGSSQGGITMLKKLIIAALCCAVTRCACCSYRQAEILHRSHAFRAGEFHPGSTGQERKRIQSASGTMQFVRPESSDGSIKRPYEQLIVRRWQEVLDVRRRSEPGHGEETGCRAGQQPGGTALRSNEIERCFALKKYRSPRWPGMAASHAEIGPRPHSRRYSWASMPSPSWW